MTKSELTVMFKANVQGSQYDEILDTVVPRWATKMGYLSNINEWNDLAD